MTDLPTDAVVVLAAIHPRVDLYGKIKGCARVYGRWMYYGGTFYLPTHHGTTAFILYAPRHERCSPRSLPRPSNPSAYSLNCTVDTGQCLHHKHKI